MVPRVLWLLLGIAATGFGIAGAVLPLLPTTPFLLVATYAFARSSPRLHAWLMSHRQFGPLIANWQQHGAIGRRAKQATPCSCPQVYRISGTGFHVLARRAASVTCAGVMRAASTFRSSLA